MSFIWRTKDTLAEPISKFKTVMTEFECLLDEKTDINVIFDKYEDVKQCKRVYTKARDAVDKPDSKHSAEFMTLCDRLRVYEEKLLMYGIDLKKRRLNTNKTLLDEALRVQKDNTTKLAGALAEIHNTLNVAGGITTQLAENREKIGHVASELDAVESELHIANKRITNFAKRLSTDKVFIAMTTLAVTGAATAVGLHFAPIAAIIPR